MVKDPTMQQVYRDSVDSYIYILIKTGLNVKETINTTFFYYTFYFEQLIGRIAEHLYHLMQDDC